jgi:hypothetical protein
VVLVAVADHRKIASDRNVEVPPGELAEIGIEAPGVPAAVIVDDLEVNEGPGLENFAVASVEPEGDPEAAVVAEEEGAFLASASAAEEEEDSVLALAAVGRPGPGDATADGRVGFAFGAAGAAGAGADLAAESGALARGGDPEAADAAAAFAERAGATEIQTIEAVVTAAEGAGLVVQVEPPQVSQPTLAGVLQWSQQWASKPSVGDSRA